MHPLFCLAHPLRPRPGHLGVARHGSGLHIRRHSGHHPWRLRLEDLPQRRILHPPPQGLRFRRRLRARSPASRSPESRACFSACSTLKLLQEATGKAAGIRSISLAQEKLPASGFGFRLSLTGSASKENETVFVFLAPASQNAAVEAAEMLRPLPLRPNPKLAGATASVPLEVAFETGYLFLNLESVKTLEHGDMLLPEAWPLAQNRAGLRIYHGISSVLVGECTLRDGSAVLETPLAEEVETSMDSSNDLEIRLSFELDRRLITVGELSSIAPGFTFPLTNPADSLVTIRANGKAIARGRIVDMNGTLGVQVTETL
ncbi:MAG: type III secretion system cytoplasmic ring protein SctQ [Mailhella sp.]|nr:type III secretion system cytoplasmic ring protein SctQ [Mailhella sp.]